MEEFQIDKIQSNKYISQEYSPSDINLLNPININKDFGLPNDIIELHIFNSNGDLIESNYNYKNYISKNNINNSSLFNNLEINPNNDLLELGYTDGQFDLLYNFNRNLFSSSYSDKFFIKEISSDRTEIKITTTELDFISLQSSFIDYITKRNEKTFYSDFVLNFSNNNNIIGVNVSLDTININEPSLYIKLYEPLPSNFSIKNELWINEIISDPYILRLNKSFIYEDTNIKEDIKGPNFNIDINQNISTSTPYLNISNLIESGSYLNKLKSLKDNISINIDYNEFNNFIHFSSIEERIENFYYKLKQIQTLNNDLNSINNISGSINVEGINTSLISITNQINYIEQNLDEYEQFLYYESGSNSFPKISSTKPYINYSYNSPESLLWLGSIDQNNIYYGGKLLEANNYDNENRNYLWNNLPEYIKVDPQNDQLKLLISMLGQHFDNIWVYIKDITNKNINDNRLTSGISKDLVAEALKSLGIKLYTNSRNQQNLFSSILGVNPDGTFLPETGSYKIENYITASNYTIPDNDIQKEVYKRLYHNIPYLLKSKGTKRGLRALINCFGIPDTILNIKEYGGVIKELDLIENKINKFNYSLNLNENSSSLSIPFLPSNQQYINTGFNNINPDTIEFRFKLNSILPTQSLLESDNDNKIIRITYITNSLANIDFGLTNSFGWVYSNPIQLPLYNNDWWNINITRETGSLKINETSSNQNYILTIGNKNQFGIEYIESSSIFIEGSTSSSYNRSWVNEDIIFPGGNNLNNPFSGEIQEFRYWIGSIPINNFKDHILNPKSISYLNETGSYNNLIFRLPLGSELDNNITEYFTSSHPSNIESFISGGLSSSYATLLNTGSVIFDSNYEEFLINSANTGLSTISNQKIKIIEDVILTDNVLSKDVSIVKKVNNQIENSNNLEVAFSPQDSINNNIIEQLGNFNIDEYIGDPRYKNNNSYPDLDKLKEFYFKKYISKSNVFDLVKLLSYFDNSLFKMIKDFVPAKVNLSTGLVIKSHLLERNKAQIFEPIMDTHYYEGNIDTAFISSSNALDNNTPTNYISYTTNENGNILKNNNFGEEFYNGELSDSHIVVHYQNEYNIIYEYNKLNNNGIINNEKIILDPLLNNIEKYPKNNKKLNVDYSTNINTPSNINYITSSLLEGINNSIIYSDVQESNYSLKRHNNPRYDGCKLISKEYNIFNKGDISFGNDPVINNNKIKFAYFEEITSQSLTLPGRSNVYIKYLIDENSNITELSKQNKNIFEIQSLFNIDKVDILLDNNQLPSKQKQLDGLNISYAGGFKFEPIIQNLTTDISSHNSIDFIYENDIQILNNNNSLITSSLPPTSITIGVPQIEFLDTTNNPINTPHNFLNFINDFKIKFPINRNTPYPGELRQRITGSISINIQIEQFIEFLTYFYTSTNGTGTPRIIRGIYENSWLGSASPDDPLQGMHNNIRSIDVPFGAKVIIANGGGGGSVNNIAIYNTPGLKNTTPNPSNLPLCLCNSGVDYVKIETIDNIMCSSSLQSFQNDFGSEPTNNIISNTFSLNEPRNIIFTFDVIGDIIIPEGTTSGIFYLNKINTTQQGIIRSNIRIQALNNGAIITPTPLIYGLNNLNSLNQPYYFTNPPEYIYLTGSQDFGFNSGSSPSENWYFERVNNIESGSFYNKLVGSYYLSNIIYDVINSNNRIIQSEPDISVLGYEVVDNYMELKIGDLVRFWNYDKNSFPNNFENEIKNIIFPQSIPSINSYNNRLIIELKNEIPNQSCLDYYDSGSLSTKITNFIILSKKPDETNIVINNFKREGKTSSGIILPSNITKELKSKSGNIIKNLKNQNLI